MINTIQQVRTEIIHKLINKTYEIKSGNIVSIAVHQYKNKKRKQEVKGVCIGIKYREGCTTLKIRNIIAGEPVEQTFLLESPLISNVSVIGDIQGSSRAKKYYLRHQPPGESKVQNK